MSLVNRRSFVSPIGWERFWALSPALLLWAAFPPLGLWPVAWIAPFGWLRLVRQQDWKSTKPYRWLYLAGIIHWLMMVQWVRLPHWSAYFGWLALSAYLAVYIPLFVGLSRILVHRWRVSSVLAAPIVWTGLEMARAYFLTGFALMQLGHSQVQLVPLVQIADLTGAYGVSFVVLLVAACIERLVPAPQERRCLWPVGVALTFLGVSLFYGTWRLRDRPVDDLPQRRLRVALIQGVFDTQFDGDEEPSRDAFFRYLHLSRQAVNEFDELDLVVWPESMFTGTQRIITYDDPVQMIPEWDGTLPQLEHRLSDLAASGRGRFIWVAQQLKTPILVGVAWDHYVNGKAQRFNSAVLTDRGGEILARYDKMHRVMFGEYIPLGNWFPWLYQLTPMPGGLTRGDRPVSFQVGQVRLAPSICFENTVPHLIRRQVRQLVEQGESPDVLVTMTNDGWFWGSSLLDVHLACGVFRSIEMRRPMLIAANTGFSAWIDANGKIMAKGPRRAEATLFADVLIRPRWSGYLAAGDWPAGLCLLLTSAAAIEAFVRRRSSSRPPKRAIPEGP